VEQPAVIPNILELNSKLKNNDRIKKMQQQIRESNKKKNLSRFPFLENCIDS
jgi:hypothetical protein